MAKLQMVQNFNTQALKNNLVQIDNPDFTDTLECKISHTTKGLFVDFIETIRSQDNQWQQPDVVTDKKLQRFMFSQTLLDLGLSPKKLEAFIHGHFNQETYSPEQGFDFDVFHDLAQRTQNVQISLPQGRFMPKGPRKYMTDHLPVTVHIDDYDFSNFFTEYQKYGADIVDHVFDYVVNEKNLKLQNELFSKDLGQQY